MEDQMRIVLTTLTLIVALASACCAQDAKTIEAAKKEGGKVVIYGSLESQVVDEVLAGFRKKTGLNAEYWRASAMSVMNRSMVEYRAGSPLYDIVLNNSDPLLIMANEGMIARYDSPIAPKYPKDQIDARLGPISRYGIVGVLYHKGLVKPEDAPNSIEDLANPKYKGMLVMADPTLHVTPIQWPGRQQRDQTKYNTGQARKGHPRLGGDETDVGRVHVTGVRAGCHGRNSDWTYVCKVCVHRREK